MSQRLLDLVNQILDEKSWLTDPLEIASVVCGETDRSDLPDFYEYLLRGFVAEQMRNDRNTVIHAQPEPETSVTTSPPQVRSAKLEQRRSWFRELCQSRIFVNGQWTLLGACSSTDLLIVADERRKQAAAHLAMADFYTNLRIAMEQSGALMVSELSDAEVNRLHSVC